jgi:hypothetical protein
MVQPPALRGVPAASGQRFEARHKETVLGSERDAPSHLNAYAGYSPAAVPLLLRSTWRGPRRRQILVAALFLLLLAAVAIHPSLASIPWVGTTLNWEGINGSAPLPGRSIALVTPTRFVAAMVVYISVCILAGGFGVNNTRNHGRGTSERGKALPSKTGDGASMLPAAAEEPWPKE